VLHKLNSHFTSLTYLLILLYVLLLFYGSKKRFLYNHANTKKVENHSRQCRKMVFSEMCRLWEALVIIFNDSPLICSVFKMACISVCRCIMYRRFGAKCGGCEQEIGPSELVRRARSRVYHLKCFTCVLCRKQLSTGEELYMLDENRFICKDDYLAKFQGKWWLIPIRCQSINQKIFRWPKYIAELLHRRQSVDG